MRRFLLVALALSCGGNDDTPDAEAPDAAVDAPPADSSGDAAPRAPLEGPDVAFTNEEVCFESALPGDEYVFHWGDGAQDTVPAGRA